MKLYQKTADELSRLLKNKEVSAIEVVGDFLDRIEEVEPYLKAFITHTPALALETAREVDNKRVKGEVMHPLAGIPVAVKDNMCTEKVRSSIKS